MCADYDGSHLYRVLDRHLREGCSLLELGSGPGNDIAQLRHQYQVTGSDLSDEFLRRCQSKFSAVPWLRLDAVTIATEETYDCVFSNKVLHHLPRQQLEASFKRQQQIIKPNGVFTHTFWLGDKEVVIQDMLFVFYDKNDLIALVSNYFTIRETFTYTEFDDDDSLLIVAVNDQFAQ
nr:class I SAM-dependent methyltransferase [Shewanella sp. NIFS-20-20]